MFCGINAQDVNFVKKQAPFSFNEFIKEKGVPISVFEDLKINPQRIVYKNSPKVLTPAQLAKIKSILDDYAEFVKECQERKLRWLKTENYMESAKKDLNLVINDEKRKLNFLIIKIKNHLPPKTAQKFEGREEFLSRNIISDGNSKIYYLSLDAAKMASTKSVVDVINYVNPHVNKITENIKDAFDILLRKSEK